MRVGSKLWHLTWTNGLSCAKIVPMSCDDVTMVSTKEQVSHPNARYTKTFRSYDQDQMLLMPPSLDDWL